MAIEYILDLPCPVKETFPTESLVPRVKSKRQAAMLLAMTRKGGDQRPLAEISITRRRLTPQGPRDETVTLQQLLDADQDLAALEPHCRDCRANVLALPFGCYGSVSYPLKPATESWLMSLLPAELSSTAGKFLSRAIKDLGIDGKPVAEMRRRPELFEARAPLSRQWGSLLSRTTVTSDQILHAMLCVGALQPSHCRMLCLFLGLLPHDLKPTALGDTAGTNAILAKAVPAPPQPEAQLQELARFLRAMALASVLDVHLMIDA